MAIEDSHVSAVAERVLARSAPDSDEERLALWSRNAARTLRQMAAVIRELESEKSVRRAG